VPTVVTQLTDCENVHRDKGANAAMYSVYEDVELHDWLRWAEESGSSSLKCGLFLWEGHRIRERLKILLM
jgi:hypothetical protein